MKTYFFALRRVPRQRPWLQHARGMCSSVAGPDYMTLKCKLMRGGTSKGLFFRRSWLPEVGVDAAFAAAMGSRDRFSRQLDGMGGGTSSTSKVAIVDAFEKESAAGGVGRRDSAGCDVSYMFGQVSVADETVDYSGTCGNLASAVGVFAVEEGLVVPPKGSAKTTVSVWEANRGSVIRVSVPLSPSTGMPLCNGDVSMPGVDQRGAGIDVEFVAPGPRGGGGCLPTGMPNEELELPGGDKIRVTLVDAGNPLVVVSGRDLGLTGKESRDELNSKPELLERLEAIRSQGAVRMGADQGQGAEWVSLNQKATPKIAWVMPPTDYADSSGAIVRAEECDLVARVVSMGAVHQAFTGTGSLAIAVAGGIKETLVAQAVGSVVSGRPMRLGHTAGSMRVFAQLVLGSDGTYRAESAGFTRTARTLMEGYVRVPFRGDGSADF